MESVASTPQQEGCYLSQSLHLDANNRDLLLHCLLHGQEQHMEVAIGVSKEIAVVIHFTIATN